MLIKCVMFYVLCVLFIMFAGKKSFREESDVDFTIRSRFEDFCHDFVVGSIGWLICF